MIEDLSDLVSEVLGIVGVPIADGSGDFIVDLDSVDEEVLSNLKGETDWVSEFAQELSEESGNIFGFLFTLFALGDSIRKNLNSLSDELDSLLDVVDFLGLDEFNCIEEINNDSLAVSDTLLDGSH